MKLGYSICLICFLACCLQANGQRITGGSGAAGIVLMWEGTLPKNQRAEIQRSEAGKDAFKTVHTLRLPNSPEEVVSGLSSIPWVFQDMLSLSKQACQRLFEALENAKDIESIPMYQSPNVQFVLGTAWLDSTAVPGNRYEYRLLLNGMVQGPVLRIRHTKELDNATWKPVAYRGSTDEPSIQSVWYIPNEYRASVYGFLCYRSEPSVLNYQEVQGIRAFSGATDSIFAVFRDTLLPKPGMYHYAIRTVNRFGALGPVSEYVQASNFPPDTEPLLVRFTATGDTAHPHIALHWNLLNPWRITSMDLYRSRYPDRDFTLLTKLPSQDSTYTDYVDDPMESFFYYFELHDWVTGQLLKTPYSTALTRYQREPLAPKNVYADTLGSHVLVQWETIEPDNRGFYVVRTEGFGEDYQIVSPFLFAEPGTTSYSWLDTSSLLKGNSYYSYAVLAESHGYLKSPFSEGAQVKPNRPVFLPVPSALLLTGQGEGFTLTWDVEDGRAEELVAFRVFQRSSSTDSYRSASELLIGQNFIEMERPKSGTEFTVKGYDAYGNESVNAIPVQFNPSFDDSFGVKYLKAENLENGIQLQWNRPVSTRRIQQYHLFRSRGVGEPERIAVLQTDEIQYLDITVARLRTYYYFLVTEDADGQYSRPSEWTYLTR